MIPLRTILLLVGGLALVFLASFAVYQNRPPPIPQIKSHFPATESHKVSRQSMVLAAFDQSLAPYADSLDFEIRDAQSKPIRGAVSFDESMFSATFAPIDVLSPGTYTVSISIATGDDSRKRLAAWTFTVPVKAPLDAGKGGSIALITATGTFDSYYAEILRAEGLNNFTTMRIDEVTRQNLAEHQVAIVGSGPVANAVARRLRTWVQEGGNLLVMRPSGPLAALAGIAPTSSSLDDAYLRINTGQPLGNGLVSESMQYHGPADQVRVLKGADVIARLYADADTYAGAPAVTLRDVGNKGGQVAAFTFDLATSIVQTRQGNPDWSGQDRDGLPPVRPNDLFFGQAKGDPQADFADLDKVGIPQADEQMRLLTRLISHMHRDKGPLPRFWYFPKGYKAILVMAADDHGTRNGTRESFERMLAMSPEGCDVAKWECPRATSWMYPSGHLSDARAAAYEASGFDLGAHITTYCQNWSRQSLQQTFTRQLPAFRLAYPSLKAQHGSRLHCIVWSEWAAQTLIERNWGIRFDMNYYYWPASWIKERPGFMTGSGIPMRFSDNNGNLVNVYQQATHLVNDAFADPAKNIAKLLDRALGPEGYYGAFGTHYDFSDDFDVQLMDIAQDRGVPMVSAQQMLDWVDGRNASSLSHEEWDGSELKFTVHADERTNSMLRTLLPIESTAGSLQQIHGAEGRVEFSVLTLKGVEYAMFATSTGPYTAAYGKSDAAAMPPSVCVGPDESWQRHLHSIRECG